ncbi:hypothetical protein BJY00DRAFT_282125 [Aspergillus carlsbadensis]|nr:hypothetical protein BJY00DRAFT_282125 [Aspergillus carlsbadensis]
MRFRSHHRISHQRSQLRRPPVQRLRLVIRRTIIATDSAILLNSYTVLAVLRQAVIPPVVARRAIPEVVSQGRGARKIFSSGITSRYCKMRIEALCQSTRLGKATGPCGQPRSSCYGHHNLNV